MENPLYQRGVRIFPITMVIILASNCIKLALPTITYLDEDGNVIKDTSSITNHSIKVTLKSQWLLLMQVSMGI